MADSPIVRFVSKIVGRTYQVQPSDPKRYALRLLLLHERGATSFEDLRTVDGELHHTFNNAAKAMGILDDDAELIHCLDEAAIINMPPQMRQLFATLIIFQTPADIRALFEQFKQPMSEDVVRHDRQLHNDPTIGFQDKHVYLCLWGIDRLLKVHGKSIADWELSELPRLPDNFRNPEQDEENIDIAQERELGQKMLQLLTNEQRHIYDRSCIASTLLINGSTAFSTFQIPIPLLSDSTCNIKRQSVKAEKLLQTTVFIWDEASMIPVNALKVVDILLRDITRINRPFGGKFMFLGGDFRQVLPIVFKAEWLFRIGNGQEPQDQEGQIELPDHMLVHSLDEIVDFLYPPPAPGEPDIMANPEAMAERCCLTTTNDSSHEMNQLILDRLHAPTRTYLSTDRVTTDNPEEAAAYPVEF
eukprot:gene7779-13625_t